MDDSEQPQSLVTGMDAATRWPAVQRLRAWELDQLRLVDGETLLDVGCGPGDAGIAIVSAAGRTARLLGFDASEVMADVARDRAAAAGVAAEVRIGDAQTLPYATDSVDALRTERTLQWIPDAGAALAELVRVLRPGGRLVVTDTDWDSLTMDLADRRDFDALAGAMRTLRGAGYSMGRQLLNRCRDLGLRDLRCVAATHVVTSYDRTQSLEETGIPPLEQAAHVLATAELLDSAAAERFIAEVDASVRADRFFLALTMYAVYGVKPPAV